ncbi:MAG: metalloregulator ArsR/SmtB family transcription factor [Candidatus Bathyarchaeota archaeon]|jgi:ArsR family transcriptional regulator
MRKIDQRLRRLIESNVCQADDAREYREELLKLSHETAGIEDVQRESGFFKALSDENRLRILKLLRVREMCICELMIALGVSQPNLSHHIGVLENAGFVERTKKGKWVFCSLSNPALIDDMFAIGLLS